MVVNRFENAHTQEVCSLVFSENENMLASGGNDNKVSLIIYIYIIIGSYMVIEWRTIQYKSRCQ